MSLLHLPKRFFGSLSRKGLSIEDQTWVSRNLLPGEQKLWDRMGVADQRHACKVARRTVELLGEDKATRPIIAAALLHDIGKLQARVNTFERVMATLAGTTGSRAQIEEWSKMKGWMGKAGLYLMHNEIGAEMLQEAGSDELTVKWAREHELVHTEWTLPEDVADALWRADNR